MSDVTQALIVRLIGRLLELASNPDADKRTRDFLTQVIRLTKGILTAYEAWLNAQPREG